MKSIVFIYLFCGIFSLNIYAQHSYIPLVKTGNQWNIKIRDANPTISYTHIYKVESDTLINNKVCKKISFTNDSSANAIFNFAYYMYEDSVNQKIYILDSSCNFRLHFNFNVQVGDTLTLYTPAYNSIVSKDTFYISQIDEELLGGVTRKRISTKYKIHDTIFIDAEIWYEGIGTLKGLNFGAIPPYVGPLYQLLCFKSENSIVYGNASYCYYSSVGIQDIEKKEECKTYPNPANIQTTLHFNRTKNNAILQVYNLIGSLIETKEIPAGSSQISINVENYKNGIYFARILFANASSVSYRFEVQH